MDIIELKNRSDIASNEKGSKLYTQFGDLLSELRKRELPQSLAASINDAIEQINSSTLTGGRLAKLVKQKQTAILKQAEKESKLVPKNYYRNLWMVLGFTSFGLPIGVAVGLLLSNIGLLGLGLPFGMAIGAAVGSAMDKKAASEGRQLNVEIKN